MKLKLLFLILLFVNVIAFGQKSKLTILKESKIKIISFNIDNDPNRLPLLDFTILNKTKNSIIFNKIVLNIIEFKKNPRSSSSSNDLTSKVLIPIAGLDLTMPNEVNTYLYDLTSPIQIVQKDAATIQIRIHSVLNKKNIVPSQLGMFRFKLLFVTYDLKAIESNEIVLGN
jgi:hypothetical protein